MGDQRQFTVKQIIWAKVSDYPWWPARIVKALTQRNRNIYKVHFFGDLSYCYLQSQQLLDFESGFAHLQEKHFTELILKKSIQLAKAAFQKSKTRPSLSVNQQQCFSEPQPFNAELFEQTKFESKPLIQNIQKYQPKKQTASQSKVELELIIQCLQNINEQNVVQIIMSPQFNQIKRSKGYNNRKQALSLQLKLKQMLLKKYNLSQVSKLHSFEQKGMKNHDNKNVHRIHRKKFVAKSKNKQKNTKSKDIFKSSTLKLYKMIRKHLGYSNEQAKTLALQYFETLDQSTKKNRKQLARNYLSIIKSLKEKNTVPIPLKQFEKQKTSQSWPTGTVASRQNETTVEPPEMQGEGQAQMSKFYRFQQQSSNNLTNLNKNNGHHSSGEIQYQGKKEDQDKTKITMIYY